MLSTNKKSSLEEAKQNNGGGHLQLKQRQETELCNSTQRNEGEGGVADGITPIVAVKSPKPRRERGLFDDDSGEEDATHSAGENSDTLRRSIPGEVKTARAQIHTVQYNSPPSPRNVLAPDLRNSLGSKGAGAGPLKSGRNGVLLGLEDN